MAQWKGSSQFNMNRMRGLTFGTLTETIVVMIAA